MINIELTEWETMVLRAAVSKHVLDAPGQHVEACREIMRKSTLMNFGVKEQAKELARETEKLGPALRVAHDGRE